MALLIAESLLEKKGFVATDVAQQFQDWAKTAQDVGVQTAVLNMARYSDDPELFVSVSLRQSGFECREMVP